MSFRLISGYKPTGDQPQAIQKLVSGIRRGKRRQTLLGVTGSGKTFTIANVIAAVQKPTLVIAHNKTLAAQLYQEFKEFFPENSVNYFVSYYDFYQPEAYIPQTDTYIEKETSINEEIDKLRLQTTSNLLSRRDVIVVASVSCIYNLGNPQEYFRNAFLIQKDNTLLKTLQGGIFQELSRKGVIEKLVEMQYQRNQLEFKRGTFVVRGGAIEIYPSHDNYGIRIDTDSMQIEKFDPLTRTIMEKLNTYVIFPAKHYFFDKSRYSQIFQQIEADLEKRMKELIREGKSLEAQRLKSRVAYDLEMIRETGYVNGIENYSRYFDGRTEGDPPYSLLDYFPKDYLLIIDESHITIPQIRGMYNGDRSRKQTLIDFGFRLPAALDNRPLKFTEFEERMGITIFTSATPEDWELSCSQQVVEQLIRPTGLTEPLIEIRPTKGQIHDLISEIRKQKRNNERSLVITLTKRMAEDLSDYLGKEGKEENKIKIAYLHDEIETVYRTDILKKLRQGDFDVLVGVNLLREGLDLPEVSLVVILDADKEGFLRNKTSLIQTMGRAARHINGRVIMYADKLTKAMEEAIKENNRRREYQLTWNRKHNIIPTSIIKPIRENILPFKNSGEKKKFYLLEDDIDISQLTPEDLAKIRRIWEKRMREAAKILDFEGAAFYRDKIKALNTVA